MQVTSSRHLPSTFQPRGRKRAAYELSTRYAGLPGYVPSEPIRQHVADLVALKLPLASIARDAGCGYTCVLEVHEGAWETVRTRHAIAIRAVDFHPNERQQVVLAIGAIRRARALYALGWGWVEISARTGLDHRMLCKLAHPTSARIIIDWAKWAAIRDVFEQLSGTPGPDTLTGRRARAAGLRHGWAPPLDWEGHDIDDPRVIVMPSGPPAELTRFDVAEARRQEVARLTAEGCSIAEIADRMAISQRQVQRCRRALSAPVEWVDVSA